jgi:hypothetical protein
LATIAAAAMALAGAGAAAGPRAGQAVATGHVRTAGIAVVKQVGLRNYAGPNCPGQGWNCTSATRVLQISADGGQNKAECTPSLGTGTEGSSGAVQMCDIKQEGSSNSARCVQRSTLAGAVQSCVILQTGANNRVFVQQSIDQSEGSSQAGQQIAKVSQGPGGSDTSASNDLKLSQDVKQMSKSADPQTQDAYQSAVILQTALGAGSNSSNIDQSQLQKAFGSATQSQNASFSLPSGLLDCVSGFPTAPNSCADVVQHADAGKNANDLHQSIDEDANSGVVADQDQGSPNGGLEGHVHQDVPDTSSGSSKNKANQSKRQKVSAPSGSSQFQYDPVRCCGTFSQEGGSNNSEDINQSSALDASEPLANQVSELIGESRSPRGSCAINQHAKIGDGSETNSASFSPCPFVILVTSCEGGNISEGEGGCTAFPPDTGEIDVCLQCIAFVGPSFLKARP